MQTTDLARVLSVFGLGAVLERCESVARGAMGAIYEVVTDTGRFAVKELFPWNAGLGVAEELAFTARARSAGVRIPMEILDAAGNAIVVVGETRFRVYEWFDFEPAVEPPVQPSLARAVGELIGRLHTIGQPTDAAIDPWYTTAPELARFRRLEQQAMSAGKPWAKALSAEFEGIEQLTQIARVPTTSEVLQCHRDLDPSNVLPMADGTLGVVDWEDVGPLAVDQELGGVLLSWCTDGPEVSAEAVAALIDGYSDVTAKRVALCHGTFAVEANRRLNFLCAQAEAALDEQTPQVHATFGDKRVREWLRAPLRVELLDQLIHAGSHGHP